MADKEVLTGERIKEWEAMESFLKKHGDTIKRALLVRVESQDRIAEDPRFGNLCIRSARMESLECQHAFDDMEKL